MSVVSVVLLLCVVVVVVAVVVEVVVVVVVVALCLNSLRNKLCIYCLFSYCRRRCHCRCRR